MKASTICSTYCIGCGLCKSELNRQLARDNKGYLMLVENMTDCEEFLSKVCPATDSEIEAIGNSDTWGKRKNIYSGHSNDCDIRRKASSGGVLTALSLFLLDKKKVDGIIQVMADPKNPTGTVVSVSECKEQVLECCGSRYSISSPWIDLKDIVDSDKIYAAIAKPCDIKALRRLQKYNGSYSNIKYMFSFFCAGMPSNDAQKKLLEALSCSQEDVKGVTYRGNGWPGMTMAIDEKGNEHTMKYANAWGGILGRDVHPFCRLCMDGIGEDADISCGDGWYLTADGTPDFTERDGRNVIFTRSESGEEILQEAVIAGYLTIEKWSSIGELNAIQKYQFTRKSTMRSKIIAYKIFGKVTPVYSGKILKKYAKFSSIKEKIKLFLGTSKRIIMKKI